ncbi:MAG: DUF2089 domain-containing protein [Chloroflexi bacterium]|nr:DUF2089 domain-containing protein [Chloroflexota bacterium]
MMQPVLGKCPVCGEDLIATRLHCPNCDTTIEGRFALERFHRLTPDQMAFVELFIRCEGKLNRVQDELGLSYPTVRNRLNDVIRALGYQVAEQAMSVEERRSILNDLAQGKITAEEAVQLLKG